jgi:Ca2+-binding RTX toxin-like protein
VIFDPRTGEPQSARVDIAATPGASTLVDTSLVPAGRRFRVNGAICGTFALSLPAVLNITGGAGNETLQLAGNGWSGVNSSAALGAGIDTAWVIGTDNAENFGVVVVSQRLRVTMPTGGSTAITGTDIVRLEGRGGADQLGAASGITSPRLVLDGGAGNDLLTGGTGDDQFLEAAAGNGADRHVGGAGVDTVTYSGRTAPVVVTLDNLANDGAAGEGDNAQVENVTGGSGNDSITGSNAVNRIGGGPGADRLVGGSGNDVLTGGAGDDTFDERNSANGADDLDGGEGFDITTYARRTSAVVVDLDGLGHNDDGQVGEGDDVGTEGVVGSIVNDVLQGGAGNDVLQGERGNDQISGAAGNDAITGGLGNDQLSGDDGNDVFLEEVDVSGADRIVGGAGVDLTSYALRLGPVRVSLDGPDSQNDGAAAGSEGDSVDTEDVDGTSLNDVLTGSSGPNHLRGMGGNDTVEGAKSSGTVVGPGGTDFLEGNAGTDLVVAIDGPGRPADTVAGGSGAGNDRCRVDPVDLVSGCEVVEHP